MNRLGSMLVVLGLGCGAALLVFLVTTGQVRGSIVGPVFGGLVSMAVALAIGRALGRRRPRSRRAVETAEALGLTSHEPIEAGFHRRFGRLPGIPAGGNVRQVMSGRCGERSLTIFQHHYVISTGYSAVPVFHTVYLTDAPHWPSMTISRRRALGRLVDRFRRSPSAALGTGRGLRLEEEMFNHRLRVKCENEDFAITLLHPEMQRFLLEKTSVVWHLAGGWCGLIYSGSLRPDRIEASIDRLARFWQLVPDELDVW